MKKLSPKAQEMGITIDRLVTGYAYAKSGNAHNSTERLLWVVRRNGASIGSDHTYRGALELAEMYAEDPC